MAIRKSKNVIQTKKVEKVNGLNIVIPANASANARKAAIKLGKKEITEKVRAQVRNPTIAVYESQIAESIGKRTFTIGPEAHRSTKYFITANGKSLIITRGTKKGKKTNVTDAGEFTMVVRRLARDMGL